MILMLSTGLLNHVIIIPILLDAAKRDAWISVLLACGLTLVWAAFLYAGMAKLNKRHLFDWLAKAYHPIVGRVLAFFIGLYLFAICAVTTRDTVYWIHLTFSPETPIMIFSFLFLLISALNAFLGIQSVANTASLLLPMVIVLGFFVMSFNMPHKDYSLLKPMLELGMGPVWKGTLYAGAGFAEVIMIFFLQHHIRTRITYVSLAVTVLLFLGLTLGPVMGAIVEFGADEAGKLRFPAYEQWRLLNIGRYVEHLDFFSVYQWFCGAFLRISLALFLILDVFRVKGKKAKAWVLGGIFIAILIIMAVPFSDRYFMKALSVYVLPVSVWGIAAFSVIITGLIGLARRRGRIS